jgi:o-succinylbenzoate synthase
MREPPPQQPHLRCVRAVHVRVPFRQPFTTSSDVASCRDSWILCLGDAEGREGFGDVALDPAASRAEYTSVAAVVRQVVAFLSNGGRPDRTDLDHLAAIDRSVVAAFDEATEQLSSSAAGAASSVAVNATIGIDRPRETAEAALSAVAAGFGCLKLKVGTQSTSDLVERIGAVRSAIGPRTRLRLDVNAAWDFGAAVERLRALSEFDIEYAEQPLSAADIDGHAALRRVITVPIALDESAESEEVVDRILAAGAADVLVIKPARIGGPTAVRAIAPRAAAAAVPIVISTFFETGIGLYAGLRAAAALPQVGVEKAHGLATSGMLVHDLLRETLRVSGGRLHLPAQFAVDEDAMARFTTEQVGTTR